MIDRYEEVYVESDNGMAFDGWPAAWTYRLDAWGRCGQGPDEQAAIADLLSQINTGDTRNVTVVERLAGGEQAFRRDFIPATSDEVEATVEILEYTRSETIELLDSLTDDQLDWDDPDRMLPSYAKWRTIRQLAWHVVNTESRYYLPMTGLGYREPVDDLRGELGESHRHVVSTIREMPPDTVHRHRGEVWTAVKLLRRLAWHERGELAVMRDLATRASTT